MEKYKSKRTNPVAKHSMHKSGAGFHKSKRDYDRKNLCEYCDLPLAECTGYKCWIR